MVPGLGMRRKPSTRRRPSRRVRLRATTTRGRKASQRGRGALRRASRRRSRGRPRRSSANPARLTSTTTLLAPAFVTRTVVRPAPASSTCAGEAVSATGWCAPLAPAEADASRASTERRAAARRLADHRPIDRVRDGRRVVTGRNDRQRRREAHVRRPDVSSRALRADVVPMRRSGAGAIGIAAFAPPASCGPICPPAGAVAVIPSGRSAGGTPSGGRRARIRPRCCSRP